MAGLQEFASHGGSIPSRGWLGPERHGSPHIGQERHASPHIRH